MKKVGILTQPLGKNFGGIMQNYALQRAIEKLGFEVETLDRLPDQRDGFLKSLIKTILKRNKYKLNDYQYRLIFHDNLEFIRNNIVLSSAISSTRMLKEYVLNNNFHAIIVGSDQTWRPRYSPNIYNYFFDFIPEDSKTKRVVYASSFGTDAWEYPVNLTEECKTLATRIQFCSVREDSGVTLARKHLNLDASLVLDPTLLLDSNEYKSLFNSIEKGKEKVISSYILDNSAELDGRLGELAESNGMVYRNLYPKRDYRSIQSKNVPDIEKYQLGSVNNWLSNIFYSDVVFTDSFHGMVFSIMFNKKFFVLVNKERGASRFSSLLSLLGLTDRIITSSDFSTLDLDENIEFDSVNAKISSLRSNSIDFLKQSL